LKYLFSIRNQGSNICIADKWLPYLIIYESIPVIKKANIINFRQFSPPPAD